MLFNIGIAFCLYLRFKEQEDALTFTRMPYALFLGVPIERKWLCDTASYRHNPTRHFLGYPPFVENQYHSYNLAQGAPDERLGLTISGFKNKHTNKQLFEKLTNSQLSLEAATIRKGDWSKVDEKWISTVLLNLSVEKVAHLVLEFNKSNITMDEAVLQAELYKFVQAPKKKKRPANPKSDDANGTPELKKARNFLENY